MKAERPTEPVTRFRSSSSSRTPPLPRSATVGHSCETCSTPSTASRPGPGDATAPHAAGRASL